MQDELSPVWDEVKLYIEEGLSVIPIRDKKEGDRPAKSPYGSWKAAQKTPLDQATLWNQMEGCDTTAVAIVCGAVSGNLEIIDIDVKYLPGIDATFFAAFKEFYPDLFNLVRIQKTPSGGYHVIYRCEEPIGGNVKLAGRPATPQELEANPKCKAYYFLETRGEGGYFAAAPALGYKVVKANKLPILTKHERDSIIHLAKTFNEWIDQVKEYTPTKTDNSIYDENPFEDYNRRIDGPQLAIDLGWKLLKRSGDFMWFSRPDSTKPEVHLSWGCTKRLFKVFTTKTDLEEKSYSPANFLNVLRFQGDKKATYSYLIGEGYGKVKPKVEAAFVKKAAINGGGVQANFSDKAKAELEKQKAEQEEKHPYGIFWEQDDEGKIVISRERLYAVAAGEGFRLYRGEIVRIMEPFIHEQTERKFFDEIKDYIHDEDGDTYEDICNSYESFLQKSGAFTISRLPELDPELIAKDTRQHCQKFFQNGYLHITKDGAVLHPYADLAGQLVFANRVQRRDYRPGEGGLYVDYLNKAIATQSNLRQVIGYLSHEYKDASLGYIVILTEQVPDPKQGGGSGKNLFGHLLKGTTSVTGKAASQTKMDDKIFQIWKGEKIFTINDLPPNFDIVFFKDISTDGFVLKILYKNEIIIEGADAFKLLLSTNFSYEVSDGGLRRRIIPIEFTPFFTLTGGVRKHYGKLFPQAGLPDDWTAEDWAGYDNYIAGCVIEWFKCGMELLPTNLSDTGWEKQFIQNFGQTTFEFIQPNWKTWLAQTHVSNDDFKIQLTAFYEDRGTTNDRYKLSPQKMNEALKTWGDKFEFDYQSDIKHNFEHGISKKCRVFLDKNPPPF